MSRPQKPQAARKEGVSAQTDALSSTLFGDALDLLADGAELGVLLALEAQDGTVTSLSFTGDGTEVALEAAHEHIQTADKNNAAAARPQRYALVYEGAVETEDGSFADALLMEFGERGWCSYSAFSFYEGRGEGDNFRWTEPAPAGELEPLL